MTKRAEIQNRLNFRLTSGTRGLVFFFLFSFLQGTAQTISPYLIGNNAWYDGTSLNNLWGSMKTAGFQTIRLGGAGAEGYSAISSKYLNLVTGIRSAGAEPIVQVARYYTDQQVRDLITNLNITNGMNVKLWSIGNEPDHENRPSTVEEVSAYIKRISSVLKSVDPTIKVMGPETAGFQSANYVSRLLGGDMDISGKDANGNYYIDIYTWHRYMFVDIAGLEADVNTFLAKVSAVNSNRPVGQKISWGLTEFNTSYNNDKNTLGADQNVWSFRAGQTYAEVYALGMRKGAAVMTAWSMLEGEVERKGTDLSLFDKDYKGRSNYYHSLMLGQNMKSTYVLSTDNQSNVSIISMKDETGIAVMILNKEKTSGFDYSLRLNTNSITHSNQLNINVSASISQEVYGYIAPAATQMLVFDVAGTLIKRYIYTAIDAYARRGPVIQTGFCNNPPSIALIPKQIIPNDKGVVIINLSGISDGDKCTQGVTVTAQSSNTEIVAVNGLNYTTCSKTAILELLPKTNGTATITINVTDVVNGCTSLTTTTTFEVQSYAPVSIPGKVEAEDFIDMYGVQTQPTTDMGGGYNVGYIDASDWMDYGVRVERTSTYDVNFRLASFPTTTVGAFKLVNGTTTLATVTVNKTTGWQNWTTQTTRVNLPMGDHVLRVAVTGSGLNINWLEFVDTNTSLERIHSSVNKIEISHSSTDVVFDFSKLEAEGEMSMLHIVDFSGQMVLSRKINSSKEMVSRKELKTGLFIANVQTQNGSISEKFILN